MGFLSGLQSGTLVRRKSLQNIIHPQMNSMFMLPILRLQQSRRLLPGEWFPRVLNALLLRMRLNAFMPFEHLGVAGGHRLTRTIFIPGEAGRPLFKLEEDED